MAGGEFKRVSSPGKPLRTMQGTVSENGPVSYDGAVFHIATGEIFQVFRKEGDKQEEA